MTACKDAEPADTVARARRILREAGLLALEEWAPTEGRYSSVRLTLDGIDAAIGTNGKGASPELALASAYGEMMERLQNFLLYPAFLYARSDPTFDDGDPFRFDPREVRLPAAALLEGPAGELLRRVLPGVDAAALSSPAYAFLREGDRFVCVPFRDASTGEAALLPLEFLYYAFGSTGMSAGNTREEALLQAVCEILERWAMREAMEGRLLPRRADRGGAGGVLRDRLDDAAAIGAANGYRLAVGDCGFADGLPVACVVMADPRKARYFVKFGCHPDAAVAVERCLSELFQNKTAAAFEGWTDFDAARPSPGDLRNLRSAYRDGRAAYPSRFLEALLGGAGPLSAFPDAPFPGNAACLESLLSAARGRGLRVLSRDCGFLGFPACHAVVPGLSVPDGMDAEDFARYADVPRSREAASRWPAWTGEDADFLSSFVEAAAGRSPPTFKEVSGLPLDGRDPLASADFSALLMRARTGVPARLLPPLPEPGACPRCGACPRASSCSLPALRDLHRRLKIRALRRPAEAETGV